MLKNPFQSKKEKNCGEEKQMFAVNFLCLLSMQLGGVNLCLVFLSRPMFVLQMLATHKNSTDSKKIPCCDRNEEHHTISILGETHISTYTGGPLPVSGNPYGVTTKAQVPRG